MNTNIEKDPALWPEIIKTDEESERPCHCCDESMTPPMLIGMIARMQGNIMRNSESDTPIMSQSSCRMILRELALQDDVSQLFLTRRTGLKAPTVSVAISKLEGLGYIRRQRSDTDAREYRVFLTESGHALEESTRARIRATDELAMQGFSEEETETLRAMLLKIARALEANENAHDPHM